MIIIYKELEHETKENKRSKKAEVFKGINFRRFIDSVIARKSKPIAKLSNNKQQCGLKRTGNNY